MLHLFAGLDLHTGLLLLLALAFVLFYEAINGFHDTANAVATVIYTRAMRSQLAVVMAAVFNFFGVLLGGLSVAYAIVHMLPTDLLLNMGSAHGLAMVFSMLLAAIIWNLGTWYFGLPASSSHTLIGAIIGIGLTNAMMTGTSVVDALNIPKVINIFGSLIISPIANLVLIVLSIVVTIFFFREAFRLDKTGRNKMFVAFILMIEAVLFYILYAQMPTSLNFFAINNVHHEILGFAINPVSFQALNPFWVVVASPVLAAIYTRLGSKGKDLTMPMKFTLGMFLCALGFLTAAAAGMWFADAQGLTSPWFIVLVYLFQSLGELLISALGLAMVAALVPQHLMGFILGMWFLTQAAAFLLGGYVATFTAVPENITDPLQTLPIYTGVFSKIGLVTLAVTVVMAIMVPWLNRMINTPGTEQ